MKNIIVLVSIVVGITAYSQEAKSVKASQVKGNQKELHKHKDGGKIEVKVKEEIKPTVEREQKGNAFGKDKGELSGKEFGEQRSEAARSKVKPKNNEEAEKAIQASKAHSKQEMEKASSNLDLLNDKLEHLKKEGKITEEAYQAKRKEIELLLQRKAALESKLKATEK